MLFVFYCYLGFQPQLQRGPLGSVVIAGGVKNGVVSNLVLWELKHGKNNVGGQARTFVDLLEADTRAPRDCLPAAMDHRVGWRKRAKRVDLGRPSTVVAVVSFSYQKIWPTLNLKWPTVWHKIPHVSGVNFIVGYITYMYVYYVYMRVRYSYCHSISKSWNNIYSTLSRFRDMRHANWWRRVEISFEILTKYLY